MKTENIVKFISKTSKSSTFVAIKNYTTKKGKVSDYVINFNSDYKSAVEKSVIKLFKFVPQTEEQKAAKEELMNNLRQSMDSNTLTTITVNGKDVKGIRKSKNGKLFITGFLLKQDITPKTEKEKIFTTLPISKFRQFEINPQKMKQIVIQGKVLKVE
jgi:hypothetical protein